ncbi:hypothetical protein, partial [Burkholderia gladioli]|uniref:hypothetical protein n=1 Tax=Burkholderia gladioli TaxID=28095 RepID=UPI0034DB5C9F
VVFIDEWHFDRISTGGEGRWMPKPCEPRSIPALHRVRGKSTGPVHFDHRKRNSKIFVACRKQAGEIVLGASNFLCRSILVSVPWHL